jgi:hypothetical protein
MPNQTGCCNASCLGCSCPNGLLDDGEECDPLMPEFAGCCNSTCQVMCPPFECRAYPLGSVSAPGLQGGRAPGRQQWRRCGHHTGRSGWSAGARSAGRCCRILCKKIVCRECSSSSYFRFRGRRRGAHHLNFFFRYFWITFHFHLGKKKMRQLVALS